MKARSHSFGGIYCLYIAVFISPVQSIVQSAINLESSPGFTETPHSCPVITKRLYLFQEDGTTPLMWASLEGQEEIVNLLLSHAEVIAQSKVK